MINNINFISNNVKRVQSTNKRLKLLKYLKHNMFRMVSHFFKKPIQLLVMILIGNMILKVKSFTRTGDLTLTVF